MTLDYFCGQAGELFSFFRIPKALFQEQRFQNLSTDAKTLYGILLDRMSLSVKNEWFDQKGRVFIIFTVEDVKRTLRCADNKATRLLRELEGFGLIERKRRGQGKPCLVYVKNFSSESSKESVKNRDNDDSCGSKIACQDPVKSRGIKKKENKTEMNNTNLILSDESEKMKNRELLEEYFSRSLEMDLLLRLYSDDEDTLHQIVNLLVDTCATNRKLLHIAGDDKPAEVVRSRFMKL
uniref:replication initiator protein A n=1 Tax=Faecalibacterium sp. TaxID=1971605 RepID=UPI003FF14940